jgi:hypothetical protein
MAVPSADVTFSMMFLLLDGLTTCVEQCRPKSTPDAGIDRLRSVADPGYRAMSRPREAK